ALQGETPLINVNVDSQAIAEVVANWTGIPVGKMVSNEIKAVLDLQNVMGERVIGQPQALEAIAQSIRTSRAGLTDPRKPIGVFSTVGSSGVGKTETAGALAVILYAGEQNIRGIKLWVRAVWVKQKRHLLLPTCSTAENRILLLSTCRSLKRSTKFQCCSVHHPVM